MSPLGVMVAVNAVLTTLGILAAACGAVAIALSIALEENEDV